MATQGLNKKHIEIARSLHPRLLNFFRRYPPAPIAVHSNDAKIRKFGRNSLLLNSSPAPSTSANAASDGSDASTATSNAPAPTKNQEIQSLINPFLPWKNPLTGRWRGPSISLRRQAELFKLATASNVLPLMPLSPKHPEVREQKRIEQGLRVQGTGVGKKVKGKYWERTMRDRLDERRKAMEGMPEMIREWKERGHGRGWKKWPK